MAALLTGAKIAGALPAGKMGGAIVSGGAKSSGGAKKTIGKEPIWSSGTTNSGQYLSAGARKAAFKKSRISGAVFKKSSPLASDLVPIDTDEGGDNSLEQRVSNNERKITLLKNVIKAKDSYGGKATTLESISKTLEDIGNALALDFTHRVTQKEQSINSLLEESETAAREDAEAGAEKSKKTTKILGKAFDKVTKPAQGFLKSITDFFGSIFTGIIASKALKWLSNNPGVVTKFFEFFTKNMNLILTVIGGVLVFKVVKKLVRAYKALRNLGRLMGGKPGALQNRMSGKTSTAPMGGGIFRKVVGSRRGVTTTKNLAQDGSTILKRNKSITGKLFQQFDVGAKQLGSRLIKTLGAGPGKKTLMRGVLKFVRPFIKRIPFVGALIDFGLSVALGENPGRAAFGAVGAALLGGIGTIIGGPVGTLLGGLGGDWAGRKLYDLFFGGDNVVAEMNRGGTVEGKNVGDKDSVPAMLTVGEKVIPREASRKFAPILDDMIKNNERGSWRDVLSNFKDEMRNDENIQEAHAVLKNVFKEVSSSLTPPNTDDEDIILPPIKDPSSNSSGSPGSNTAGGTSLPSIGPEDPSNDYISYYREQLGIY